MSRFLKSIAKIKKAAAWRAMPPAIICKPLRFIAANTPRVEIKNPLGKTVGYDHSPEYKAARRAADQGNGALVKSMARALA